MFPVQCAVCRHYLKDIKCEAFPKSIPDRLITGEKKHDKPLPDQGNDIVFEPIEEEE